MIRLQGLCILLAMPGILLAHTPQTPLSAFARWEPWITLPLAVALLIYLRGALRLLRRSRQPAGTLLWRSGCFLLGSAVLLANVLTPLQTLSEQWFFVHMAEHELLMVIAAPLLALARPLAVMLWGLPEGLRRSGPGVGIALALWRRLSRPVPATVLHGLAIWIWHIPALFDQALQRTEVHALQHLSFLLSALLFWSALLGAGRHGRTGTSALCLFVTALHTGLLGALLVFARRLWYRPAGGAQDLMATLTALEDQQLAGLVMWVPGCGFYALAALLLLGLALLQESAVDRREVTHAASPHR